VRNELIDDLRLAHMCRAGERDPAVHKPCQDLIRAVDRRVDRLEGWFVMFLCTVIGALAAALVALMIVLVT
jgi:hypothetical protein